MTGAMAASALAVTGETRKPTGSLCGEDGVVQNVARTCRPESLRYGPSIIIIIIIIIIIFLVCVCVFMW